jgi:putative redox-active protein with C_GCAxxG_C_C motif
MSRKAASELFRGKEKCNCAQAVHLAYIEQFGGDPELVAAYKKCGVGRAPGGMCGALYAARGLLTDPGEIQKLEERFAERTMALACRTIRKAKRATCQQCVDAAAELLDEIAKGREAN